MVTSSPARWPPGLHDTPPRFGKVPDLFSFDAPFFAVHGKQAVRMDPQLRKLLEVSHEAWTDAGIDPRGLRGSDRVGVYVGACGSELHSQWLFSVPDITGYEQTGCVMSMFANRLSFVYGFKGPSKAVDTACSSAFMALHDAIVDLQRGRIDYALVGGASAILRPAATVAFQRLKMLSPDGACKSFDASANGYARAEGIAAIVLRRSDVAPTTPWLAPRPPYARILAAGTNNDGHTEQGITFPSGDAQRALGAAVCAAAGVDRSDVAYVEAHGTGTVVGDAQELAAIDALYGAGAGRAPNEPLLIGSVKSNMGHCEGCSGLAGIIKLCLAYEHGALPPNLHFASPNPNCASLVDGTLTVVSGSPRPWTGGLAAISSFGFGGSNVHVVVDGRVLPPPLPPPRALPAVQAEAVAADVDAPAPTPPAAPLDVIVPVAARTAEGVQHLLDTLAARSAQVEGLLPALTRIARAAAADPTRLPFRGSIANGVPRWEAARVSAPPPIWFMFSGNGSQWAGMAKDLMVASPTFNAAVKACAAALTPFGVDLLADFEAEDGWSTPALATAGLVAVQVGLVDTLREEWGIEPAGMFGHSAGEIAASYAAGCQSREATAVIGWLRGSAAVEGGLAGAGLMAAVGLGADKAIAFLAAGGDVYAGVVVGCDNSPSSVTLSGPADAVRAAVTALSTDGVFVRELNTYGVAYHSPALAAVGAALKKRVAEVLPSPRPRPSTWISTAFAPGDESAPPLADAAYHAASYTRPVLFTAAVAAVPDGALLLEIGPHALLRSPLRQCNASLAYVATMKKGDPAAESLRDAVASAWRKGADVPWPAATAPATTPLPRDVRSALVSWNHSTEYEGATGAIVGSAAPGAGFDKIFDLASPAARHLADHVVDGRVILPATSYLVTAWEALAAAKGVEPASLAVEFCDVRIHQAVATEAGQKARLSVTLAPGGGFFVTNGGDLVASGTVKPVAVDGGDVAAVAPAGADAAKAKAAAGPPESPRGDDLIKAVPAGGDVQEAVEAEAKAEAEAAKADATPETDAPPCPADDATTPPPPTVDDDKGAIDPAWGAADWPHPPDATIDRPAFYRAYGRAGIQYGPAFRAVLRASADGADAQLAWTGCWIVALDNMMQALGAASGLDASLRLPVGLRRVVVSVPAGDPTVTAVPLTIDTVLGRVASPWATVEGLDLVPAPRRAAATSHVTSRSAVTFTPYGDTVDDDTHRATYMRMMLGAMPARLVARIDRWAADTHTPLPRHLAAVREIAAASVAAGRDGGALPEADWTDAEADAFWNDPTHHLARLSRDLVAVPPPLDVDDADAPPPEDPFANPMQRIVSHPEHEHMYDRDPGCSSFAPAVFESLCQIILQNVPAAFSVAEVGAGTGGLTKRAFPALDSDAASDLLRYVSTDVTPAFCPALVDAVGGGDPKFGFATWDVNAPAPASLGGPFDVVLATNALHTGRCLADVLTHVAGALREGGFLCFFEQTCVLPTMIWGTDAAAWTASDEREWALWASVERWQAELAAAGFVKVCLHRDELDSAAFFLYRKRGGGVWGGVDDGAAVAPPVDAPTRTLLAGPPMDADAAAAGEWVASFQAAIKSVAGVMEEEEEGKVEEKKKEEGGAADAAPASTEPASTEPASTAAPTLPNARLWLVGDAAASPGTAAAANALFVEPHGALLRLAYDADGSAGGTAGLAATIDRVAPLDLTRNIVCGGRVGTFTLANARYGDPVPTPKSSLPHGARLQIGTYGDLDSFHWVENEPPAPHVGDVDEPVAVDVSYSALNFKDVMLAYGKLNNDAMGNGYIGARLGFEFAGTLVDAPPAAAAGRPGAPRTVGARVMGVGSHAMATRLATLPHLVWEVPAEWSLKEAATVPVAYMTAYYALIARGSLTPRDSILIHSATGAVGMAATRIALARGCDVYVTCGSAAKRDLLLQTFGERGLKADHIGDSRSTAFEATVMHGTRGRGVKLALNALAGDLLHATVRCVATGGSLLEIGKFDILQGTRLPMAPMHHNISFQGINLDSLFVDASGPGGADDAWRVHGMLAAGLAAGEVVPLPWTAFPVARAQDAFRYLAAGTHVGKVLLQVDDGEGVLEYAPPAELTKKKKAKVEDDDTAAAAPPVPIPSPSTLDVAPGFAADPTAVYIVTGGLGGFGLALAVWLAQRGATRLVLTSRRGVRSGEQARALAALGARGVDVTVSTADVETEAGAEALLQEAGAKDSIGGVFHLAMVIDDRLMSKQDGASWTKVVAPKAVGAANLAAALDAACPTVPHFVMFSSVAAHAPQPGQANYCYANGCLDALARARRAAGRPALAVQWGAVGDVGFVAEVMLESARATGKAINFLHLLVPQPIDECLNLLGELLCPRTSPPPVVQVCARTLRGGGAAGGADDGRSLVEVVLDLLGAKEGDIAEDAPLSGMGIDSMQAVEVRSRVQRMLGRPFPLEEVAALTLAKLRALEKEAGVESGGGGNKKKKAVEEDDGGGDGGALAGGADAAPPPPPPKPAAAAATPPPPPAKAAAGASVTATAVAAVAPAPAAPAAPAARPVAAVPATPASPDAGLLSPAAWAAATTAGMALVTAVAVGAYTWPARAAAATTSFTTALLLTPLLAAIGGLLLLTLTAATRKLVAPGTGAARPLQRHTLAHARYWIADRAVASANALVARSLTGTPAAAAWLRALGARVGAGAHVASVDVADADLFTLGDHAVLDTGASVACHAASPDGWLHFAPAIVGAGARVAPLAHVPAGGRVAPGATLPALRVAAAPGAPRCVAKAVGGASAGGLPAGAAALLAARAAATATTNVWTDPPPLASRSLPAAASLVAHAFLAYAWGVLHAGAAVAGHAVFAVVAGGGGGGAPGAAVAALLALTTPALAPAVPLLLPGAVVSVVSLPRVACGVAVGYSVYAVALAAAAVAFKHALLRRVAPCTYPHASWYAARLHAVRLATAAAASRAILLGGCGWDGAWLRVLGARVGTASAAAFRYATVDAALADVLAIGAHVHVGDRCAILPGDALSATTGRIAAITLGDQAIVGVRSALLPGAHLGVGTVLGAATPADGVAGVLADRTLYMGTPAVPLASLDVGTPRDAVARAAAIEAALPFGTATIVLASLATATVVGSAATATAAAVLPPGPAATVAAAVVGTTLAALATGAAAVAAKWGLAGRQSLAPFTRHTPAYHRRLAVAGVLAPLARLTGVGDAVLGSAWHATLLQSLGARIGARATLASDDFMDYDLLDVGEGAVVGMGATLFAHVGTFRGGEFTVEHARVTVGDRAIVAERALALPGTVVATGSLLPALGVGMGEGLMEKK